ncbi:MAG: hypothetical protein ABIW80_16550 [Lapillicoccus sp.]
MMAAWSLRTFASCDASAAAVDVEPEAPEADALPVPAVLDFADEEVVPVLAVLPVPDVVLRVVVLLPVVAPEVGVPVLEPEVPLEAAACLASSCWALVSAVE